MIVVTHTDLPANDFSNLFEVIDTSAESYARDDGNVFPSAVGRSFFRPVLPQSHVDLGWSSYAAMWLSRTPAPNPGHVFARSAVLAEMVAEGAITGAECAGSAIYESTAELNEKTLRLSQTTR